jgi:hypothetical protein
MSSSIASPVNTPEVVAAAVEATKTMTLKDLWRSAKQELKERETGGALLGEMITFGSVGARRAALLKHFIGVMTAEVDRLEAEESRSHDEAWATEQEVEHLVGLIDAAELWLKTYQMRYPGSS